VFLQNHGLIITADDVDTCLRLQDKVNDTLAAAFAVSRRDWPSIRLEGQDSGLVSQTGWLQGQLLGRSWDLDFFTRQALYPDQLVFLAGQVGVVNQGNLAAARETNALPSEKCVIFRETGEVWYQCGANEAMTIEETLCAILFITGAIQGKGLTVCTMDEAGQQFISNWESESYRKTIAAQ